MYLADLGEAKGCSTKTIVIHLFMYYGLFTNMLSFLGGGGGLDPRALQSGYLGYPR